MGRARTIFFGWMPLAALCVGAALFRGDPVAAAEVEPEITTPIRHVVVIFQENISFDHYFATYPRAANPAGETVFEAAPDTPTVNGIPPTPADQSPQSPPSGPYTSSNNPTLSATGDKVVAPFRLDPVSPAGPNGKSDGTTCDEDHTYSHEQSAYHRGQNDRFVQRLGSAATNCAPDKSTVMGYFDGNTVTALWNYAQHFAMSDNAYGTVYGPSSPGAINLASGTTHGVVDPRAYGLSEDPSKVPVHSINQATGAGETSSYIVVGENSNGNTGGGSLLGDARPYGDDCNPTLSSPGAAVSFGSSGYNIGDLLNNRNVSWGWFQGGFARTAQEPVATDGPGPHFPGAAICGAIHQAADGGVQQDYIAHHEPFQYYDSTRNPHHVPPGSPGAVGHTDEANHQYDLSDLFAITSESGVDRQKYSITGLKPDVTLPAVTYLKAPGFMDGHARYSNPRLEQQYLADIINALMRSPYWSDMAIFVTYDDSDGWYDHVTPPLVNPSRLPTTLKESADYLTGPGRCGKPAEGAALGRCGYGPRLPFLVISPYSRVNFVDHTVIDQTSILRFIEENWRLGFIDAPAPGVGNLKSRPLPVGKGGSFDQIAGSVLHMFDFTHVHDPNGVIIDSKTGLVISSGL